MKLKDMRLTERFDRRSLEELGRGLKEKQERLRDSVKRVLTTGFASRSADPVEWVTETLHEEIQIAFLNNVNLHLVQIEAALERLAHGDYGLCHECGEFIELERLRVLPFALRCTACLSRMEIQESQPAKVSRTTGRDQAAGSALA
jgi:RNA polymerase-binding transcription factor DksA